MFHRGEIGPPEVVLIPDFESTHADAATRERLRKRRLRTAVDERGFFQITGVAPGTYRLTASAEGASPAHLHPIRVQPDTEVRLDEPLVLGPGAELDVYVVPEATPEGGPWRVELMRDTAPSEGYLEVVDQSEADLAGSWRARELPAGSYLLQVGPKARQPWFRRTFELVPAERRVLTVEMPVVEIRGSLTKGEEPVAGEVVFGDPAEGEQIPFTADEEGRFEGHLPREGEWEVVVHPPDRSLRRRIELGTIEVRRREGRGAARIDLALPATEVPGIVVDRSGEPQVGARVTVWREVDGERERTALEWADDEGRFRVEGIEPGHHHFEAGAVSGATSEAVSALVLEDAVSPEVRLVVGALESFEGRVTVAGSPSPGAAVRARAADQARFHGAGGNTDAEGWFGFSVPARRLDLLIAPPDGPLTLRRVSLDALGDGPFTIDLAPVGGAMVIDLESILSDEGTIEAPPRLVLFHGGASAPIEDVLRHRNPEPRGAAAFAVPQVESGSWVLCQIWADGESDCFEGSVPTGGEVTFRVEPPPGS